MKLDRGTDWPEISKKVLKRDNFKCRNCGKTTNLKVHHIVPYRIRKTNEPKLLITLCTSCHSSAENLYRRIGVTHFLLRLIEENEKMK